MYRRLQIYNLDELRVIIFFHKQTGFTSRENGPPDTLRYRLYGIGY